MRRLTLFVGVVPAGLATGLAAWLVAGGASANLDKLVPLEQDVAAIRAGRASAWIPAPSIVASLANAPLFALTTGPGAVNEPIVQLHGVSITKRRTAALLSFDDATAEWVNVGESRSGVTLQRVAGSKVLLDTLLGTRELGLGEQTGGSDPQTTNSSMASGAVARSDTLPPGVRSPPPPASAPGIQ